jgi:hypothetical protein
MARIARHQLLGVAHHHLHRPPGHARQVIGEGKVHQRALPAEVTADRGQVDADPLLGELERVGEQLLEAEGHLVRRPHLDPPVAVDRHDARVGLDIAVMRQLRPEGVLENAVRLAEPGFHVAQREAQDRLHVRVRSLGRRALVGPRVLVDEGGARLDRGGGIDDRRQILVLHVDEGERLFRDVGVKGGDHRDLLADEAHAVAGQHGHVEHAPPHQNVREVLRREDGQDAGERLGLGRVDADDARVGQRAAEGLSPDEPGQGHVGGVAGGAADLLESVEPGDGLADDLVCHRRSFLEGRLVPVRIGRTRDAIKAVHQ